MSSKPQVVERPGARRQRVDTADHFRLMEEFAHELRSPLNSIKSWTHVLENSVDESADPTIARAIAGILMGVEQQVRLIEDLLLVLKPQETPMADKKRTQANEQEQQRNRDDERPERPEPGTLEGPGGRHEKGEQDARNQTTRRGER
jgi:signal transduction histidine kinase